MIEFPEIKVRRGGIQYTRPTPEEARAQEAYRAFVQRIVERALDTRHRAVEAALMDAIDNGWDVHVYEPPGPISFSYVGDEVLARLSYVGIAFTEQKYTRPVIYEHRYVADPMWDD